MGGFGFGFGTATVTGVPFPLGTHPSLGSLSCHISISKPMTVYWYYELRIAVVVVVFITIINRTDRDPS